MMTLWMSLMFLVFTFKLSQSQGIEIRFPSGEVRGPNISIWQFHCGSNYRQNPHYSGKLGDISVDKYHLNNTAEKLFSEGFEINVLNMTEDAIIHFTASNGTHDVAYEYESLDEYAFAAGGFQASRIRASYMAQLGVERDGSISWVCDGVLINEDWILSAAHCFLSPGAEPNLVRLGEYDLNESEEPKFTYDYEIAQIVIHPNFNINERYHDLVLICIPRKYAKYSSFINPICLPWNELTNEDLVGNHVTLTGWGATHYGGKKTPLLQEVVLEVFPTPVCHQSYSNVPNFKKLYPKGMSKENILCVGWKEDGKDACGGDSGAPIVYELENRTTVLVGIVSTGFGCGLKEYPGLYIPINKPRYLQWIKDVAFKNYQ